MKKLLAIILSVSIFLTCMPVFAEVQTEQTTSDPTVEALLSENKTVMDSVYSDEVEDIIIIEGEAALEAEADAILNELDEYQTLTKENVALVLKGIYKYLVKRDLYYKNVLYVLNKIDKIDSKPLKAAAIIAFENRYNAQKERDRRIHHKLERVVEFIKEHKNVFSPVERLVIQRVFKPVVEKYTKHRAIIIHVHRKIQQIKDNTIKDEVLKLLLRAQEQEKLGQKESAWELYEIAIKSGVADAAAYKKAGNLLKELEGDNPKVFVNGIRPDFDVKPTIIDGRTLVPLRKIAEALNAKVDWDANTRTAILNRGDKKIELTIDAQNIVVNGIQRPIDVPAKIIDGRTLVPARVVSETLDATVTWDGDTKVITIEDNLGTETTDTTISAASETGLVSEGEIKQVTTEGAVNEVTAVTDSTVNQSIKELDKQ